MTAPWQNHRIRSTIGLGLLLLGLVGCNNGSLDNNTDTSAPPAPATSAPTLTFSVNPTAVSAGNFATLSWTSSNASACSASGAWSGSKPVSGTQSSGALNATSTYTLTCTGDGGTASRSVSVTVTAAATGSAILSWTAPTMNEDGSALTLSGFNIYQGASSGNLQALATVDAVTLAYTVNNLTSGIYYFAVTAVDVNGVESAYSNIESKTIP